MTARAQVASTSKPTGFLDPYAQFPNVKTDRIQFSSASPFAPTYVASNLSQTADPALVYNSRVKGRQILLESSTRESRVKKAEEERRSRRKAQKERLKTGLIGRREAKQKAIWKFDSKQAKFSLFLPLHTLWMGYMSELLGLQQQRPSGAVSRETALKAMPNTLGMQTKLLKADFHGSILTVSQNKNPCIIGVSGIVIHETENTFKVITKDDTLKVLPKQNCVFMFAVPLYSTLSPSHQASTPLALPTPTDTSLRTVLDTEHVSFQLYGNQFRFRSADRAGRKFKHKETIEL